MVVDGHRELVAVGAEGEPGKALRVGGGQGGQFPEGREIVKPNVLRRLGHRQGPAVGRKRLVAEKVLVMLARDLRAGLPRRDLP